MRASARRYVFKISEGQVEVRSQAQTGRGTYYLVNSAVVDLRGKGRTEKLQAIEAEIKRQSPKRTKEIQ